MARIDSSRPSAGDSLRQVHANANAAWVAKRRRQVRDALWWAIPLIGGGGALAGLATRREYFGFGFGALTLLALLDITFIKPRSVTMAGFRASGESATAKALRPLRFRGFTVLHDRRLGPNAVPGVQPVDIEHLLIGPAGVFLLDSKNWTSGPKPEIIGQELWVGHDKRVDALERLNGDAERLTAALQPRLPQGVKVGPMLVVHTKELKTTPRIMGGVTVLLPQHLGTVFESMRQVMTATQAADLARSLDGLLTAKTGDRLSSG